MSTKNQPLKVQLHAAQAIAQYIDACGSLITPTLDGLLDTEAANAAQWAAEGWSWEIAKIALTHTWNRRS